MHENVPTPISHRDIKIENLNLEGGKIKHKNTIKPNKKNMTVKHKKKNKTKKSKTKVKSIYKK